MLNSFIDMESDDIDAIATKSAHAAAVYSQPCPSCRGRGRFISHAGRDVGECFKCHGAGKLEFKTSPFDRSLASAARSDAKSQKVQAWRDANRDESAWIIAKRESFGFAQSMAEALEKYGTLTEGQHAAVRRLMAADAERTERFAAERVAAVESAPIVEAARLEAAFHAALNSGLKRPKIKLGGLTFKPAGAASKNPGAIYVTEQGEYLGKVAGGRFLKVRACSEENETRVADMVNDPKAAAEAYGIETGACCICSRELTDPESIARGIGPICAERFGW